VLAWNRMKRQQFRIFSTNWGQFFKGG
jgi:hypothetical protein